MKRMQLPELEDYIRSIDAAQYADRRNYVGESTELSEYITRGAISLPRVRDLVLENNSQSSAYKLLNELAWREYWQLAWTVKGDEIFEYIRPLSHTPRQGIPTAVLEAQTGITALDDGIKQLQQTGYVHNHMRMWLAGLITNIAKCDWKIGAQWMHSQLIDGDYASNHLSWQWVAGSYTGKPYLPQQGNINTYTKTEQHDTFLDKSYEDISNMDIPEALADITTTIPNYDSKILDNTTTLSKLQQADQILLYSPWTLDPTWHPKSTATRLLFIDTEMYTDGAFSQLVYDSISWFAQQIPDLQMYVGSLTEITDLPAKISRKEYPGIATWPGTVEQSPKLHPNVAQKFYPSFSSFWKQTQK